MARLPARSLAGRLAAIEGRRHVSTMTLCREDGTTIEVPTIESMRTIGRAIMGEVPLDDPLLLTLADTVTDPRGTLAGAVFGQISRGILGRPDPWDVAC